jgi:hypothetical protein
MRRRLAWTAAFASLAAAVAGLVIIFPSPEKRADERLSPGGVIPTQDLPKAFAPRAGEVLDVAQRFVATAVARKNVDDSWLLVCPSLKEGFSRETWAKGDIPVVPFPVSFGKWRLSYSLASEVDVQVALYARPKAHLKPTLFDLTVQPCGKASGRRWLVSSFLPTPSPSGEFGSRGNKTSRYNPLGIGTRAAPKPLPNTTSSTWLIVPVGVLGGLILLVGGFLVIRSVRARRAYSAHVRERQMSSSRPS